VDARREALSALSAVAANILTDGGYGATRDLLRRVTSSLEALSAYGSLPGAPSAGRLTDEIEPPGFETLAGVLPPTGATKPAAAKAPPGARPPGAKSATKEGRTVASFEAAVQRREREQRQQREAAAKSAVRDAERALKDAGKHAERAAAKLDSAAVR